MKVVLADPVTGGVYRMGNTVIANPSANFTRPADTTAYASGDLVANSTTAGSVVPMSFAVGRIAGGQFNIRRIRLSTSSTSVTNAQFRLHLYTSSPTPANGDNGAWSTDKAATYVGFIDVTVDKAFTDGASGFSTVSDLLCALPSGQTLYGLLEARAAYTPTSAEIVTVTLELWQN